LIMARKTKAELAAEREQARAAQEAHEFAQYPTRLMVALELATREFYYELAVENSVFVLRDRNERRPEAVEFTLAHTRDSQTALMNLEWELKDKALVRAEAERLRLAREAALAKLTQEERELLDL
jgi:hypothetical protein